MKQSDYDIEKHRSTVFQLYVVLIISIVGSIVPNTAAQIMAVIFFLALIVAVPMYRYSSEDGSFLKAHMIYLSKTIWRGSFFLTIGITLMVLWVYKDGDHSVFTNLHEQVQAGAMVSQEQVEGSFGEFVHANLGLLIKANLICVAPPALYVILRIMRGWIHAMNAERIY